MTHSIQVNWPAPYIEEDYRSQRANNLRVHYLVALGQPDHTIATYSKKYPQKLYAQDGQNFNVTALHIAVLRADAAQVDALLSVDKRIVHVRDDFGWQPHHLAVLTSDAIYRKLIAAGADPESKTGMGADCAMLRCLIGRDRVAFSSQNVLFEGQNIASMTDGALQERFKITTYTDCPIFRPDTYLKLWQQPAQQMDAESKRERHFLLDQYIQMKSSPPRVAITECEALKPLTSRCFQVVAAQRFKPGQIIGEYSGVCLDESKDAGDMIYGLGEYTAKECGNFTRFCNSGFPNSYIYDIPDGFGAHRYVLVAAEDITENTPIVWNYSGEDDDYAFGRVVLFGRQALRDYYKDGLDSRLRHFRSTLSTLEGCHRRKMQKKIDAASIDYHSALNRLMYPLDNPTALLDLHYTGMVPFGEWLTCFSDKSLKLGDLDGKPEFYSKVKKFLEKMASFDRAIQARLSSTEYEALCEFVLQQIEKLTVYQIMKVIQMIAQNKVAITDLQSLPDRLKEYDPARDPECCLCDRRELEDLVNRLEQTTFGLMQMFAAAKAKTAAAAHAQ